MLRFVLLAKTNKETRKVLFKVCIDLIENDSLTDFWNMLQ